MATSFSTGAVEVIMTSPSGRSWAPVFLSTEALGTTNSDVADLGGLTFAGVELSTAVSNSCTYTIRGSLSSTAVQLLLGTTGNVLGFGSTAGTMQGRTFAFDPATFAGIRFIQLVSNTTSAAAPNATGAIANILACPFGQRK